MESWQSKWGRFLYSKATNINSTWFALGMEKLCGLLEQDKGNDYSELAELAKDKVKAIVCLGLDNHKIKKAFSEIITDIVETKS